MRTFTVRGFITNSVTDKPKFIDHLKVQLAINLQHLVSRKGLSIASDITFTQADVETGVEVTASVRATKYQMVMN